MSFSHGISGIVVKVTTEVVVDLVVMIKVPKSSQNNQMSSNGSQTKGRRMAGGSTEEGESEKHVMDGDGGGA